MSALEHPSTTVLETALDWLTVSTRRPRVLSRWKHHAQRLFEREASEGNRSRPWHLNQYTGSACGRVRYGFTLDAMLLQLSGQLADDQFPYFWPDHDTITRLDIAVTYRTLEYDPDQAAEAYKQANAWRADRPRSAKPLLIRDGDGGSTCYLGSRASSRFGRIYNKHAEQLASGDTEGAQRYVNAWRVELELHDVDAQAVAMMLAETGDRASKIRYYLCHYLGTHGITCPFPASERAKLPTGFRRRSDRESRLDWLRTSVRPSIDWLRSSCTRDELRGILGLETDRAPSQEV